MMFDRIPSKQKLYRRGIESEGYPLNTPPISERVRFLVLNVPRRFARMSPFS
jgi:hypothetical protein